MSPITRCLLLLCLPVLVITGCPVEGTGNPNDVLPDSWPINQLSIPRDAEVLGEPAVLHEKDPAMTTREWLVAFNKDGDWPGVVQHVESCLKPLGYYRQKVTRGPVGFEGIEMNTYYSPDFLTEVVVSNGVGVPGIIEVDDVEFALWVIVRQQPNELVQTALDVRAQRPEVGQQLLEGILEPLNPVAND